MHSIRRREEAHQATLKPSQLTTHQVGLVDYFHRGSTALTQPGPYVQVIVFSFSKRDCEALAQQLTSLVLNDDDEQKLLEGIFWNAVDILSEDDRKLPQITNVLPMLRRGIGVHHSGLLPIVKEVIEILFQEGLIKVCDCTVDQV